MKTANTTPEILTLTPEQFVERFLPTLEANYTPDTTADYFVRNLDTGKLELHITKPTYRALDADTKQALWDSFRWSKHNLCWISRGLPAEDYDALRVFAKHIGLADGGCFVTLHPDGHAQPEAAPVKSPAPVKPAAPAKSAPKAKAKPKAAERPETIPQSKRSQSVWATEDEICHALRDGSGYSEGKIRIAAFYAHNPTPTEGKVFLKEEYGIGGRSWTFLDGYHGGLDYNSSGFEIRRGYYSDEIEPLKLSWITVHTYINAMIKAGTYLTDKEQAKLDEIKRQHKGKLPKPLARYGFPTAQKSA